MGYGFTLEEMRRRLETYVSASPPADTTALAGLAMVEAGVQLIEATKTITKVIDRAEQSSKTLGRKMFWLTVGIGVVAILQLIVILVQLSAMRGSWPFPD